MGDGAAERPLGGAVGVDVDPLVVAGRVGEQVDPLLLDGQPLARTELLAGRAGDVVEGGEGAHEWKDRGVTTLTRDVVRQAPKVLLHDHLDGGLRPQTILDLAADCGHELPTGA